MEGMLPEYSVFGSVRHPIGSRIPTAAPSNAYPCSDGKWVLIAANSDPIFARLSALMGRTELAKDPRYTGNAARVQNVEELDRIIGEWTKGITAEDADRRLTEADIPCTLIYTAAECASDAQFRERGMVRDVDDPQFGKVLHVGVVPVVTDNPGTIRWTGPAIGAHTNEILGEIGIEPSEIERLRKEGVL